jgi:hypothetical protein
MRTPLTGIWKTRDDDEDDVTRMRSFRITIDFCILYIKFTQEFI